MVELTEAVIPTTGKSQHLTGMRIHHDHRDLRHWALRNRRLRPGFLSAYHDFPRSSLANHFIYLFQPGLDRLYRHSLQLRIE